MTRPSCPETCVTFDRFPDCDWRTGCKQPRPVEEALQGVRQSLPSPKPLRYHNRRLTRIAGKQGPGARIEAEDVLQEALTRAYQSIEKFRYRGEESFYSWLGTIAEHLIWNVSQKQSSSYLELKSDVVDDDASPGRNLRRHERFDRLEKALNRLSPDHREALVLSRFEGLKVTEIAARMKRSPNAVYKLLARAVLELKKDFGDTESLRLPDRTFRVEESSHDE